MHESIAKLLSGFSFTSNIEKDTVELLKYHSQDDVAAHIIMVANLAEDIASKYNLNTIDARTAGFLHDISRVIPSKEMVEIAKSLGLDILPGEYACPDLLHGKLSKAFAQQVFGVANSEILSAIECHSTLKAGTSSMDLVLFIADKLSWKDSDNAFFAETMKAGLEISMEKAAYAYFETIHQRPGKLKVIHPWFTEAFYDLKAKCE